MLGLLQEQHQTILRNGEAGIVLIEVKVVVDEKRLHITSIPRANLSLHAHARYLQRTGLRSPDALMSDLAPLIDSDLAIDRVPCPSGQWVGEVCIATDKARERYFRCRIVRTFMID